MENPFEVGEQRYQPEGGYIYSEDPKLRFDQKRLASFVGYVAVGLPVLLGIGGLILGAFRQSLSGFYYERVLLGDIFVGALVFIGTLMFAFRGWSQRVADLATIAGLSAYLVALFPAAGWLAGENDAPIFVDVTSFLHALAALVLFLILAFFCFFVFTKVEPHQKSSAGDLREVKKRRDTIYRVTGSIILVAIVVIGVGSHFFPEWSADNHLTFWAEAVALVAFGTSWLVHGRMSGYLMLDPRDRADIEVASSA